MNGPMIITLAVNWLIKPFTMAALGVLFFDWVFAPFIEPGTSGQYIAGLFSCLENDRLVERAPVVLVALADE
jgi:hypothetical protein